MACGFVFILKITRFCCRIPGLSLPTRDWTRKGSCVSSHKQACRSTGVCGMTRWFSHSPVVHGTPTRWMGLSHANVDPAYSIES